MVRPFGKLVLALGALMLVASPAWAQAEKKGRGFGGGFGMGGGAGILNAPNVQKDLKLSEEQTGKIQDALRTAREKHSAELQDLRDLPRQEQAAKLVAVMKAMQDDVKKELAFTPEQSKRFDQISLQTRGVGVFGDPLVAEKLKLTDDQKSQIRELAAAGGPGRGGAFNKDASKEERQEAFRKMRETQQENMKKAQALLTEEQKKEWKELIGEPIEINLPPFGGGRRPNN